MKYLTYMFAILASTLVLAGCSSDDGSSPAPTPDPKPDPEKPDPTPGTATRPTEWLSWQEAIGTDFNPQSMTITCDATGIEFDVDDQDLIASFINGECRGCDYPHEVEGKKLFFLPVQLRNSDDRTKPIYVTFRYYSHKGTKMYIADTKEFTYDAHWGSVGTPYLFKWKAE